MTRPQLSGRDTCNGSCETCSGCNCVMSTPLQSEPAKQRMTPTPFFWVTIAGLACWAALALVLVLNRYGG